MSESEWTTRKLRIDARLRSLSPAWEIVPWRPGLDVSRLDHHIVTEIPTESGPADYGFFVRGLFLGILEAKKVGVNPQNVLEQAKRYSRGAYNGPGNWFGYRVPFLFASNGEIIWFLDVRREKTASRLLANFHTAPALAEMFAFDAKAAFDWLLDTPPELITRLRDYQRRCNLATEQALIAGRREILLALATGTGKTFLTVAQIYRLLESGLVRRILFLADRKALAAQAVREFNAFTTPKGNKFAQEYEVYSQRFQKEDLGEDDLFDPKVLPNEYLTNPKASHAFVYVSTIQRMARNLFGAEGCFAQSAGDSEAEADADRLDIPIHAFDLVLVDECHRGYTVQELSIYRATINHFDAFKIALTATPAAHTTAVFGPPVFRSTVEQAILDGFLVDYEAVAIKSQVRMSGVFLKESETVERVDTDTGQTLIQYFKSASSFAIEPPRGTPLTIPEVIENIWQNVDRDYHVRILAKRLLRIDKDMSADARTQFAAWIPEGDMGRFAKELPQRLKQDFAGAMKLLRNPDFQKLLLEYPRATARRLNTPAPARRLARRTSPRPRTCGPWCSAP